MEKHQTLGRVMGMSRVEKLTHSGEAKFGKMPEPGRLKAVLLVNVRNFVVHFK